MFKNYRDISDVVSLLVYCPTERSFLFVKESNGEFWLPCNIAEKRCWKAVAKKMFYDIFAVEPGMNFQPLRIFKVWLPNHTLNSVYHVVYKTTVKSDTKKRMKLKSSSRPRVLWLNNMELERQRAHAFLRSPELAVFGLLAIGDQVKDLEPEYYDDSLLVEICESNVLLTTDPGAGAAAAAATPNTQLLQAAGYIKEDQIRLYREFMLLCYPALFMSPQVFATFMTDLGWQRAQCGSLFRAADITGRGGLSFMETMLWCAAIEPCTQHGGVAAELRCRYIFRYYDANRDSKLEYVEFKELIAMARAARQMTADAISVAKDADVCLRQLGLQPNAPLPLTDFLRSVGELRLRGTSSMLRSPRSPIGYLQDLQERDRYSSTVKGATYAFGSWNSIHLTAEVAPFEFQFQIKELTRAWSENLVSREIKGAVGSRMNIMGKEFNKIYRMISITAAGANALEATTASLQGAAGIGSVSSSRKLTTRADYSMASYTLHVRKDSPINEMLELNNFDEDAVSPSTQRIMNSEPGFTRSLDVLGPATSPMEAMAAVHYFASAIERMPSTSKASFVKRMSGSTASGFMTKQPFTWANKSEESTMGTLLLRLSEAVRPIVSNEPRLLRINSPVYAVGDLHGNLSALLSIESALWPSGAALSPAKILFLGDFVDRGPFGTELMAYLLASKVQRPNGVLLIRGNHETRDIQKMFTFYSECVGKYGEVEGPKVWNAINLVFDSLPLAAVVDGKVFCCHGGIPPPWVCPLMSAIDKIPVPLPRPAEQSTIAWELLWNDPVKPNKMTGTIVLELTANEGFAPNSKRGTGHVFDQNALDRFLLANQLSHVVRAHEMHQNGFMCQLRGRLVSVFSSSNYCGGTNDSGVALLEGGKLRLIRVGSEDR